MDPEIQRALQNGVPPQVIAGELQKRGLAVPQELSAMITPVAQQPDALPPSPGASKIGLGTLAAGAAGTLGAAGAGANYAFNPNLRAQRFLQAAADESGGKDALKSMLRQYQASGQGRGDLVTLGDLTKRMGAVTDFTATNNPSARAKLSDIHEGRQAAAPRRILGDVTGAIGNQAPAVEIQQLKDQQANFAASDQGYQGLRDRNPVIAPQAAGELHTFVTSPRLQTIWKQAHDVGLVGPLPAADHLSFEVLQDMKERLDDAVGAAFKSGRGSLGARLAAARDHLVTTMGDAIPEYKPVAQQYHQYSKAQEMLQAGMDSWQSPMQVADLKETTSQLSPQDLDYFRRGLGGAVLRDIENSGRNPTTRMLMQSNAPAIEAKLEAVFGSRANFLDFKRKLELEKQMAAMGEHIGGASTARRLGAQADVADQALEGADAVSSAIMHPVTAAGKLVKDAPKFFAGPVARRLEEQMTAQGYAELMKIIRSLK